MEYIVIVALFCAGLPLGVIGMTPGTTDVIRIYVGDNATLMFPYVEDIEPVKVYDSNETNIFNIIKAKVVMKEVEWNLQCRVTNQMLMVTILNITMEDAGTYQFRKSEFNHNKSLFVWGKPSPAIIGIEGCRVTCDVNSTSHPEHARPRMTYIWLADGNVIRNATNQSTISLPTGDMVSFRTHYSCKGREEGSDIQSESKNEILGCSGDGSTVFTHTMVLALAIAGVSLVLVLVLSAACYCCRLKPRPNHTVTANEQGHRSHPDQPRHVRGSNRQSLSQRQTAENHCDYPRPMSNPCAANMRCQPQAGRQRRMLHDAGVRCHQETSCAKPCCPKQLRSDELSRHAEPLCHHKTSCRDSPQNRQERCCFSDHGCRAKLCGCKNASCPADQPHGRQGAPCSKDQPIGFELLPKEKQNDPEELPHHDDNTRSSEEPPNTGAPCSPDDPIRYGEPFYWVLERNAAQRQSTKKTVTFDPRIGAPTGSGASASQLPSDRLTYITVDVKTPATPGKETNV